MSTSQMFLTHYIHNISKPHSSFQPTHSTHPIQRPSQVPSTHPDHLTLINSPPLSPPPPPSFSIHFRSPDPYSYPNSSPPSSKTPVPSPKQHYSPSPTTPAPTHSSYPQSHSSVRQLRRGFCLRRAGLLPYVLVVALCLWY